MDFKYPYTDFHELNLDWFLEEFKKLTADWLQVQHDWEDEQQAFQDLHDFVQDYFANLNLYQEVHDVLYSAEMQQDIQLMLSNITASQLPTVVANQIASVVAAQLAPVVAAQLPTLLNSMVPSFLPAAVAGEAAAWLADHVDPDTGYVIDNTLTISQAAADAKTVGDICLNASNEINIHVGANNHGDLTDLDLAKDNRIYAITMADNIRTYVANIPPDVPLDGYLWYTLTLNHTLPGVDNKIQLFWKYNASITYFRQYSNNAWTNWAVYMRSFMRSGFTVNTQVGGFDTGDLTDLNSINMTSIYAIQMAGTIKTKIANIPADAPLDGTVWFLHTYDYFNTSNVRSYMQVLHNPNFTYIYRRQKDGGTWYNWRQVMDISALRKQVTVDANGGGDYTRLTDALSYAYTNGNVDIYVKNGTYDITSEIDIESAGSGPLIGKNTKVYFASKAYVTCHYTGSGSPHNTFSVFNAGEGDFEIHNLKIDCSNIRYCVHDERSTNTDQYRHCYYNCQMKLDNTSNTWDSPQCIGGGLGANGIIEIDGGYYEGLPHAGDNTYGEISYHNSSASNAKSEIWIRNIYCKNNAVRFGYYGTSPAITPCYVNGCSFAVAPIVRPETPSSTVVNMEMTEWNNDIR